jgi:hypothetical protein
MLEFALRIRRMNEDEVILQIICGIKKEDGTLDYGKAGIYIANHPEEFKMLFEETFKQPHRNGIVINDRTAKSIWERYMMSLKRLAGQSLDEFAKDCVQGISKILEVCWNRYPRGHFDDISGLIGVWELFDTSSLIEGARLTRWPSRHDSVEFFEDGGGLFLLQLCK